MVKDDFLSKKERAEDILLGSLGYGESAHIIEVSRTSGGYRGRGVWKDGEGFEFNYKGPVSELELWALAVIEKRL